MKSACNLFLAGDSTVADCPVYEAPMAGWGQFFQEFFTEEIVVYNHAKGGASSNSFIKEGRLETILKKIEKDDYLMIQFGHNDQKPYGTQPFTTYPRFLNQYIEAARGKGAHPVLVTSVHRRHFDEEGKIVNTLGEYPASMIQLAEIQKVPLINLWEETRNLYEGMGPELSKQLFVWFGPGEHPNYPNGIQDNTHFCENGAKKIGELVAKGIRAMQLPIACFLK